MPEFMRGVINLRGGIVPVIDLRLTFGMSQTKRTVNTCVIIVEVTMDEETTIIGTLADSVQEVLDLGLDHIEPAPRIGTRLNTEFIKGMGRQNDQFLIILDIDKVLSSGELLLVQGVLAETAQDKAEDASSDTCNYKRE
jgi:purine-binding chemotaxis protein CheW